jgi:hypothetical protein
MYKWMLTHEVLPGKLHAMKAWFEEQDEIRQKTMPDYPKVNRYTTVFGNVHQVVCEVEQEKIPEEQWNRGWASGYATLPVDGAQGEFLQFLVPGRTDLRLLKQLNLEDGHAPPASTQEWVRYKLLLLHEVLPGKLATMKAWFKQQDRARKEQDATYIPRRRYTTVFGSVHQVLVEMEAEKIPEYLLEQSYAEHPAEGAQGEFLQLIVPGRTEMRVLQRLA